MKHEIVLNSAGVREMLQSPEMQALLLERATAIKERAGDGFETDVFVGKNRANASVFATTKAAQKACLDDNVLIKAVY